MNRRLVGTTRESVSSDGPKFLIILSPATTSIVEEKTLNISTSFVRLTLPDGPRGAVTRHVLIDFSGVEPLRTIKIHAYRLCSRRMPRARTSLLRFPQRVLGTVPACTARLGSMVASGES